MAWEINHNHLGYIRGKRESHRLSSLEDLGQWKREYLDDFHILNLAYEFKVDPQSIWNKWDWKQVKLALEYLERLSDIRIATYGLESIELDKSKSTRR